MKLEAVEKEEFHKNSKEIIRLFNLLYVCLSFDKSNEQQITEYLQQINENYHISNNEFFEKCDVIIYFLTNKFLNSKNFIKHWSKRAGKIILVILLEKIYQV